MNPSKRAYEQIIADKIVRHDWHGFDAVGLNPNLKDFQQVIVDWAVRKGRAAIFAECGLGKTLMQLDVANQVATHTDRPYLILTPLAVANQTVREAAKFGIAGVEYLQEPRADMPRIVVTNYERLDHFDCSIFGGVSLDESSILKAFTGKTKQLLCDRFAMTEFRHCWTATPAPNDHLELGNHSQFLGVMPSNEMISRWFINDSMQAGNYRLKGHAEADYWAWVTSWAACVATPSDIGCSDDGYILPALNWHESQIEVDHDFGDGKLFTDGSPSSTDLFRVHRKTLDLRVAETAKIIGDSKEPWAIWCHTNDESAALVAAIPGAVEVRGDMSVSEKERRLKDFQDGTTQIIVTKPSICGFGLNWQHCANVVFVGLSYSYEQMYQAIRRHYRFGQSNPVNAHLITTSLEHGVLTTIKRKEADHRKMQEEMVAATKLHGIDIRKSRRDLPMASEFPVEEGDGWKVVNGDCVLALRDMPADYVGYSVFSPPFSNLYIYSDSAADMGNCADDDEFFEQFSHLATELRRVTIPGRLCSVHCKDLPRYKGRDGAAGLKDFPGEIIRTFEEAGWSYHSRVTIWKDPVIEMQRTKNHGLLYKQLCKDSSYSRQGMADYVITFRKWEDEDMSPVRRDGERFATHEYVGEEEVAVIGDDVRGYSIQVWQRYASPVWFDIQQTNVLNTGIARDAQDEKHICPLQLDVIERCIELWSNPGDLVFSPFTGIGSEGYVAIKMARRFLGMELKESYFRQACRHLAKAAEEVRLCQVGLFEEIA